MENYGLNSKITPANNKTRNDVAIPLIPGAEVTHLQVWPKSISLTDANDRQSLVAQLVYSNGLTVDVSDTVQGQPAKPLVEFENGYWLPLADGTTQLNLSVAGHKQSIPVTVSNATTQPSISFTNDVMPVFSKTGCNAGSCHGASRGKDGFRLSLYGFDPAGDYHRLTREHLIVILKTTKLYCDGSATELNSTKLPRQKLLRFNCTQSLLHSMARQRNKSLPYWLVTKMVATVM